MPGPGQLKDAFSGLFSGAAAQGQTNYLMYFTWIVWAIAIWLVLGTIYFLFKFKYKVTIFEGSIDVDRDGYKFLRILRVKRDRAKPIKDKGVDKWKLLMNWVKIPPLDNKYIQPNNHVFLFKTGPSAFNPMPIKMGNPSACYSVDPYDASFFMLGVQQDAQDYKKDDAMKKAQITFIAVCILLLVFAGFILWLSFKSANNTAENINIAARAMNGLRETMGVGGPN